MRSLNCKKIYSFLAVFLIVNLSILILLSIAYAQENCNLKLLRPVYFGQKNIYVKNIQLCLKELGYKIPDQEIGRYQKFTQIAVSRFYRNNSELIYKLAKNTNTLWQIKNWRGRKIGAAGLQVLKDLISKKEASTSVYGDYVKNEMSLNQIIINLLLKLLPTQIKETSSSQQTFKNISQQTSTPSLSPIISSGISSSISGNNPSSGTGGTVTSGSGGSSISTTSQATSTDLAFTLSDSYSLTPIFIKNLDYKTFILVGNSENNGFYFIKFNIETGSILKSKNFKSSYSNFYLNEVLDSKDGLILLGNAYDGKQRLLLVKIDYDGNIIFSKSIYPLNDIFVTGATFIGQYIYVVGNIEDQTGSSGLILVFKNDGTLFHNIYFSKTNYTLSFNDIISDSNKSYVIGEYLNQDNLETGSFIFVNSDPYFLQLSPSVIYLSSDYKISLDKLNLAGDKILITGKALIGPNQSDLILLSFDKSLNFDKGFIYSGQGLKYFNSILKANDKLFSLSTLKQNSLSKIESLFVNFDQNFNVIISKKYSSGGDFFANFLRDYYNKNLMVGYLKENNLSGKFKNFILTLDANGGLNLKTTAQIAISDFPLTKRALNIITTNFNFSSINSLSQFEIINTNFTESELVINLENIAK